MLYDTWNPFDPNEYDTLETVQKKQERLQEYQQTIRAMLPSLCQEIENDQRDPNQVAEVLAPYYAAGGEDIPMTLADLTEVEALGRLILQKGGLSQQKIQTVLLRLVGATAALESVPFLLEMFRYTRRGDNFGPERRQLALWGLARIAMFHQPSSAYEALRKGLNNRNAEVRFTTIDLIIDAYIQADQPVPEEVVEKLQQMSRSDEDKEVRYRASVVLEEPWAEKPNPQSPHDLVH